MALTLREHMHTALCGSLHCATESHGLKRASSPFPGYAVSRGGILATSFLSRAGVSSVSTYRLDRRTRPSA
jgi:hypothetical protein